MLNDVGISPKAEDCTIIPLSSTHILLTNIDIVTPIHDDPYLMGKIAATNVVNDVFAMNAAEVTNFSAFMGLPFDLPDGYATQILRGMKDLLISVGSDVHGGHTIMSPWPLMGGSASSYMEKKYLIEKRGVKEGDRLILTKPMGIQAIMGASRVMNKEPEIIEDDIDFYELRKSISMAEISMTMPNIYVPRLLRKYDCQSAVHAMTDVTGFGFKGHLGEMLLDSEAGAEIEHLPVIPMTPVLDELFSYGILEGCGAEISGAMLLAIDHSQYDDFARNLQSEKIWYFDVGYITKNHTEVHFRDDFSYTEAFDFHHS